jgi:hypothetical protein
MPRGSTKTFGSDVCLDAEATERSRWLRPASTPVRRNAFCSPPAWSPLRPVRDHTADGAPGLSGGLLSRRLREELTRQWRVAGTLRVGIPDAG